MKSNRAIRRAMKSKKLYSKMIKGEGGRMESKPTNFKELLKPVKKETA
jgi:hypothetical protein